MTLETYSTIKTCFQTKLSPYIVNCSNLALYALWCFAHTLMADSKQHLVEGKPRWRSEGSVHCWPMEGSQIGLITRPHVPIVDSNASYSRAFQAEKKRKNSSCFTLNMEIFLPATQADSKYTSLFFQIKVLSMNCITQTLRFAFLGFFLRAAPDKQEHYSFQRECLYFKFNCMPQSF